MLKLVMFLAIACVSQVPQAPAESSADEFQIITKSTLDEWHPYARLSGERNYAQYLVNRPLVVADGRWNWQCYLCKQIPNKTNGLLKTVRQQKQINTETQWELQPDLKWGDGTPITGHDVKFTFEVIKKLAHEQAIQHFSHGIDSITVDQHNPRKFMIRYFGVSAEFYQMEDFFILPKHLEESIWFESNEDTQEYLEKSHYHAVVDNPGLFTGPYVVEKILSKSSVSLRENKNFTLKKAATKIPRIKLTSVTNPKEVEYLLSRGKINLIAESTLDYLEVVDLQKKTNASNAKNSALKFIYQDNAIFEHIGFNLRNPILADLNVRKALIIATDRKALIDELFNGGKNVALHNISPLDRQYSDQVKSYDFSPKAAQKLLELAGWKRKPHDKEGVRVKDEKPLALILTIPEEHPLRLKTAQILQKQWLQVGIQLSIEAIDQSDFYPKAVAKAQFRDLILFAWHSASDRLLRASLHSKEIPSFENRYTGQNIGAWRNKSVDLFLDKLLSEFDQSSRQKYVQSIIKVYVEEVPEIPLYFDTTAAIVQGKLKNFKLSGNDLPSSFWVEEWRF